MFLTLEYFGLLVAAAAVYWALPAGKLRTCWLALTSLCWIGWHDRAALVVVLGLTLYAGAAGILIERSSRRALVHGLSVAGIVAILVVFKYLGLLSAAIQSLLSVVATFPVFPLSALAIPVGLSYVTFKYISYLTDVYWNITPRGSLLDLLAYGSLFTIFVAGPIERFSRFQPQLALPGSRFSSGLLETAFTRIVQGLFKKAVLADWLGYSLTSGLFDHLRGAQALRLLAYALQIYFDFAGYSDIAIGSSRLFGLTIMENFQSPYLQPNIAKFWRSWHISLSDWIRDYVFFPLSSLNRSKAWMLWGVPVVAMGLCGLWHGAAWHFLLWGMWHGAGIAVYQFWQRRKRAIPALMRVSDQPWFNAASIALTFTFVTVGWLWFQ